MFRGLLLTGLFLATLAAPSRAGADCVNAVRLGTTLLSQAPARSIPPTGGVIDITVPACNDGGEANAADLLATARTIRGVAPTVGLVSMDRRTLYVGDGQLTALKDHPLAPYLVPGHGLRQECAPGPVVRGPVAAANGNRLVVGGEVVYVDGATTVNTSPAFQFPQGQWLSITTERCGSGQIADAITLEMQGDVIYPDEEQDPSFATLLLIGLFGLLG